MGILKKGGVRGETKLELQLPHVSVQVQHEAQEWAGAMSSEGTDTENDNQTMWC